MRLQINNKMYDSVLVIHFVDLGRMKVARQRWRAPTQKRGPQTRSS